VEDDEAPDLLALLQSLDAARAEMHPAEQPKSMTKSPNESRMSRVHI
jgi:hypothetical protein